MGVVLWLLRFLGRTGNEITIYGYSTMPYLWQYSMVLTFVLRFHTEAFPADSV